MNGPAMNDNTPPAGGDPAPAPIPIATPPPGAPPQKPSQLWEVLCHVTAFSGFIGIPAGNIVGPLIIWLLKRAESPSVDAHGKAVLNFQISWTIWFVLAGVSGGILGFLTCGLGWWLLAPVLAIAGIAMLIFTVIGAIKASNGELYQFPLTWKILN